MSAKTDVETYETAMCEIDINKKEEIFLVVDLCKGRRKMNHLGVTIHSTGNRITTFSQKNEITDFILSFHLREEKIPLEKLILD